MIQKQRRKPNEQKRWMNLPLFVLYGLSMTVGTGIFVLIGTVTSKAGVYTPLSFILPTITAGLTGFSYAEFATRHPMASGEVSYAGEAFGLPPLATVVGLLLIASAITSAAFLLVGAAAYSKILIAFLPIKVLMGGLITLVTAAALSGITKSATAAFLIGSVALSGICLSLFYGFRANPSLLLNMDRLLPPFEWSGWRGILVGGFVAFLPLSGFKDSTNKPDKINSTKRTVPFGLSIILLLSLGIFLILSAFLVLLVPTSALAASDAPLSYIFKLAPQWTQNSLFSLTLVVLINSAALHIYLASKVMFNLAITGGLPKFFTAMNRVTKTAHFAILTLMGIVGSLAYTLPLTTLAEITSALFLVLFIIINAALIRLKWEGREVPNFNAFSVYFWVPIAGLISSSLLLGIGFWGKFFT